MLLKGKLFAESPIYRGNARKTLFTRDGSGKQRLVSLAGEVGGTAEALMDAFIGTSRNKRNLGLLDRLWLRMYSTAMPHNLIQKVTCELRDECYSPDRFFDLRMGIKLNEDRGAAEANSNYKYETLFRHSAFDFSMEVNERMDADSAAKLYYLLKELEAGRFWFGAGKSKGLGRCRLELATPLKPPRQAPAINGKINHLTVSLAFGTANPVLVGWNWGKVDPDMPAFAVIEGRILLDAMRSLPEVLRQRLAMVIGGPILDAKDWKNKLGEFLPRAITSYLKESGSQTSNVWVIPAAAVEKLGKAKKHPLSKKIIDTVTPILDKNFATRAEAEAAFTEIFGEKDAKKNKRVLDTLVCKQQTETGFPQARWAEIAAELGLSAELGTGLQGAWESETGLQTLLATACETILPALREQVDQQINLLQSDAWVDMELENRRDHLRIKQMLQDGQIDEHQWGDPRLAPEGVKAENWQEFLSAHRRVQYRHMLNPRNLGKSIANDENMIAFLEAHRTRTRQELAQPYNMDFRGGGEGGREVSRKYGKPYDTVFMRMLSWAPSGQSQGQWEIYIPGSTIKGGFRKRATQVLRTLWGESAKTDEVLNFLFGAQRQAGVLQFSDAYLQDPNVPERAWCSMDGVRMDPKSGRPMEEAKSDYLFAYGKELQFQLRIDAQDLDVRDLEAISLFKLLLDDFQRGDIPLGGEKTNGFGWVEAQLTELLWLTGGGDRITRMLFGKDPEVRQAGVWQKLVLDPAEAKAALNRLEGLAARGQPSLKPPLADGFVSHRAFGGYCGTLEIAAHVLTPLSIQESGEPSFRATCEEQTVNGWDCFSLSPAAAENRGEERRYALPSKTLRGMLRHIYTIASDSAKPSFYVNRLNPADSLFGWVGQGQNQAIMGRVAVEFGFFEQPQTAWFKVPYPYGEWEFDGQGWKKLTGGKVQKLQVAGQWRLFAHAPLAPCVEQLADFSADTVQADYRRAILPGSRARCKIRFWNLTKEELERLVWCIQLEEGLAHKLGKTRQLGFGSLRLEILPESFMIDWAARYSGRPESEWQLGLRGKEFHNPKGIKHYEELKKALDAGAVSG